MFFYMKNPVEPDAFLGGLGEERKGIGWSVVLLFNKNWLVLESGL